MPVKTVAVLSPGDMGSAVGAALRSDGLRVITALAGRSDRTRGLAADVGLEDVGTLRSVVAEADLVLSIMVPDRAEELVAEIAPEIRDSGKALAFADCNAVSPGTAKRMAEAIENTGGRFIDAGIVGSPPRGGAPPRFYASGPHESVLGELDGRGISVPLMGGDVGLASAMKMCFAAITKGTTALYAAALTAAESLGTYESLVEEMESSQPATLQKMQGVSTVSDRAFRWIGEMTEIAKTFAEAGVTPKFHEGAHDLFKMIAESPIGHERPETVDRTRSLHDTVKLFARE